MVWHILVVENDPDLTRALNDELPQKGFEVTIVGDGKSALGLVEEEGLPHLAVIDAVVADTAGLELAREFSQRGSPVIVTGEDSLQLALESLQWADDFVRKPYAVEELTARIKRVLSRIADYSYARSPVVGIADRVAFDYANSRLVIEGEPVSLTPIESRLLHTLMQHRGQIVDSRTLLMRVWSSENVYEDTLRVHIHRLRSKLETDPRSPEYVLTERGVGYRFRA